MKPVREIIFFGTYFSDFFEGQTEKIKEKIDYVLFILAHVNQIPNKFLKHLSGHKDLYEIKNLVVRLDNKQVNDSGTVSTVSTDASGTIVNFNKEFLDVESITLTAAGTTPLTAVYAFNDITLSGTYSVTSGVCTVTITDPESTNHGLITGQKVRLSFSTGDGISGVYSITKVSDSVYTVDFTGQPNTSGNLLTYAQSLRIYTFKSTDGSRQSAKVGWQLRGY